MSEFKNIFRQRVHNSRRVKYRTIEEFAAALGEKPTTVAAWEKPSLSVAPPIPKLVRICEVLGVSADYLLGLTNSPQPASQTAGNGIVAQSVHGPATNNAPSCHDCATVAALTAAIKALSERKQ